MQNNINNFNNSNFEPSFIGHKGSTLNEKIMKDIIKNHKLFIIKI